jgi:hypothetical protein
MASFARRCLNKLSNMACRLYLKGKRFNCVAAFVSSNEKLNRIIKIVVLILSSELTSPEAILVRMKVAVGPNLVSSRTICKLNAVD